MIKYTFINFFFFNFKKLFYNLILYLIYCGWLWGCDIHLHNNPQYKYFEQQLSVLKIYIFIENNDILNIV